MTARPVKAGFCSSSDGCVLTGVGSSTGALTTLFSRILLLRSKGVRPRLFLISALFNQNSSMMSVFLDGVSSVEELMGFEGSGVFLSFLGMGVDVTPGTG